APSPPKPAPAAPARVGLPAALTNSLGMRFVLTPAGTFRMGSPRGESMRGEDEGPVRDVRIAAPLYLALRPATPREYDAGMGGDGGQPGPLHQEERRRRRPPRRAGVLGGRERVLPAAGEAAGRVRLRPGVPSAQRGGVGIRLPRRHLQCLRLRPRPLLRRGQL